MDWLELLIVFALAPLPIIEMKVATALGILEPPIGYHEPWPVVFALNVVANVLMMFVVWNLLPDFERFCRRSVRMGRFLDRTYAKTRKQTTKGKERMEEAGVFLIIALVGVPVPVPGSGLYTALVAAYIFGLSFRKLFPWAVAGIVVAAGVLTALALLGNLGLGV